MKKPIAIALTLLALSACTEKRQFTIEGTIEGAQDSTLYLYNQSLAGPVLLDSAELGKDGHFVFKAEAPEAPDFYILQLHSQIINISIDSTETVTVSARYPGMGTNYSVSGSDNCEKIRQLALRQQQLQQKAIEIQRSNSLNDNQKLDSIQQIVRNHKDTVTTQFIYAEPQKAYAYFALFQTLGQWTLFQRNDPDDVKAFAAVATCWETFHPNALRTEHLHNTALKGMNEQRAEQARKQSNPLEGKVISAGLIELKLPDAKGNTQTLTQLAGKVILLDFHSFRLKDSAQRILQLRELYNKYHSQGLEIYQVAIDDDEHFWKQQTEHLPWVSVYDPQATSLTPYNVQTLPEFFTIDRQGQLQKRSSQMTTGVEQEIKRLLQH